MTPIITGWGEGRLCFRAPPQLPEHVYYWWCFLKRTQKVKGKRKQSNSWLSHGYYHSETQEVVLEVVSVWRLAPQASFIQCLEPSWIGKCVFTVLITWSPAWHNLRCLAQLDSWAKSFVFGGYCLSTLRTSIPSGLIWGHPLLFTMNLSSQLEIGVAWQWQAGPTASETESLCCSPGELCCVLLHGEHRHLRSVSMTVVIGVPQFFASNVL